MSNRIPQIEVLQWLHVNHPDLHARAVVERAWVWLPVDLRGDHNKPVRESIKAFGFRFCKRGHPLPDGQTGTWAHSGVHPMPFKRKRATPPTTQPIDADAEALAFAFS